MVLETYCATVASKLQATVLDRSLVKPLIQEAHLEVKKISREQNKVAHELAHLANQFESRVVSFLLLLLLLQGA